jgi:hypothetical protein
VVDRAKKVETVVADGQNVEQEKSRIRFSPAPKLVFLCRKNFELTVQHCLEPKESSDTIMTD